MTIYYDPHELQLSFITRWKGTIFRLQGSTNVLVFDCSAAFCSILMDICWKMVAMVCPLWTGRRLLSRWAFSPFSWCFTEPLLQSLL